MSVRNNLIFKMMSRVLTLLPISLFIFNFGLSNEVSIVRFREIHCSSSRKSVDVLFCYVKTFARRMFTLNIGVRVKSNMSVIMVRYHIFFISDLFTNFYRVYVVQHNISSRL